MFLIQAKYKSLLVFTEDLFYASIFDQGHHVFINWSFDPLIQLILIPVPVIIVLSVYEHTQFIIFNYMEKKKNSIFVAAILGRVFSKTVWFKIKFFMTIIYRCCLVLLMFNSYCFHLVGSSFTSDIVVMSLLVKYMFLWTDGLKVQGTFTKGCFLKNVS